jgi:hypothetical protein
MSESDQWFMLGVFLILLGVIVYGCMRVLGMA